ncbi:hypothetical protein ACQPZX_41695 [Actinoplanes sp. CA-142083]|uniref:hypothetical protein n=1 Tax=Actinoplanes sp. CA-142083 TaxID=3239903 RepID=UPI003D8D0A6C
MSHTMIDLGEVPEHLATPVGRPPVPYRALLGALSIVMLALLAAAAHPAARQEPTVIPARLGDTFTLDGDLMYVIGTGGVDSFDEVRDRVITTYRLPSVRVVSRTTVPVPGTVVNVKQAGGVVIVGYQLDASGGQATVAYPAGGGPLLWKQTARFVAVSPADGIALLSGDNGDFAVDLATGRERWRVGRPTQGFLAESGAGDGYPDWLVSFSDARLQTWDAHTGRQIAATTVPSDHLDGMIWPVSSLLLINAGARGFDGYRLPELRRLWHTPVDLTQSWMQTDCGTVICTFRQQRGMSVLDPADGHLLWDSGQWAYAEPLGPYLLATADSALSVLDPQSGRVLGDFGAWQGLGLAGDTGLIWGQRAVPGTYQVFYGLLDPADRSIEVLGRADRVSGGCATSDGVMVCRLVDASVAVWRLR